MERAHGTPQVVFAGRVLTVRVDPVLAKSGETTREVVVRVPAVAIAAETSRGELVVIRQHRWAVGEDLYELPAGVMDVEESPLAAAQRELSEETGFTAGTWEDIVSYYPSPGYSTEVVHLFHAVDLTAGEAHGDPDEEIAVEYWSPAQARQHLAAGHVKNGILLIGLHWWLARWAV